LNEAPASTHGRLGETQVKGDESLEGDRCCALGGDVQGGHTGTASVSHTYDGGEDGLRILLARAKKIVAQARQKQEGALVELDSLLQLCGQGERIAHVFPKGKLQ